MVLERASFNPFTLETRLYGLSVADAEFGELIRLGRLAVNPQLSSVFGTVRIKSIELDDGLINVGLDATGRLSFQDALDALSQGDEADADEDSESVRARIERLSIANISLNLRDESLETTYEESVAIESFAGRGIGTVPNRRVGRPGTDEPRLHWDFEGLIGFASGGALELSGGAVSMEPWAFELRSVLRDFPLASAQPYASEIVYAQIAGSLGFDVTTMADLGEGSFVLQGTAQLEGIRLSDEETNYISADRLALEEFVARSARSRLAAKRIVISDPVFTATLDEEGSVRLPKMKSVATVDEESEGSSPVQPFLAEIDTIELSNGAVDFTDNSLAETFSTRIQNIELSLTDILAEASADGLEAKSKLSLLLSLLEGSLRIEGGLDSLATGGSAELELNSLQLSPLQPYVSEFLDIEVEDGAVSGKFAASFDSDSKVEATGEVEAVNLLATHLDQGREVASLESLRVEAIDYSASGLSIDSVDLIRPQVSVWNDSVGLNLGTIAKAPADEATGEVEGGPSLAFRIGRVRIENGRIDFSDTNLLTPHRTRLTEFSLEATGLSSDPEELSNYRVESIIDGGARFLVEGRLDSGDPKRFTDLTLSVSGYDMTAVSPYWETYLARQLAKGQFELVSNYEIRDSQLDGSNSFKIDQLTLGEQVESDKAMRLPVGFAIKLLQDPNGLISYDGLPVKGDLADPSVSPWGLVGKAVVNLILKAATSPFKFLAGVVGGREDLDSIAFEAGSVSLSEDARAKIEALARILELRPGVSIEVTANPDLEKEIAYLKRRYIAHLLANPDFQATSGLDLLADYDQTNFEQGVAQSFAALAPLQEAPVEESTDGPAPPETNESSEKKKTLLARVVGLLGVGKKPAREHSPVEAQSETIDSASEGRETLAVVPSISEMYETLVEAQPDSIVSEDWIEDLVFERLQLFRETLLASEAIEPSRVFVSEALDSKERMSQGGQLLIKLTD